MSTKWIKKLASKKVKLSLPGTTSGMSGSRKCVPAQRMENILTVQTESRLWSLDFFLIHRYFFLKNCGVEHGFDALMESRELDNMFQVWIKERKIASSTFMLRKTKPKSSLCDILSVIFYQCGI